MKQTIESIIDCDTSPYVPKDWTVEEHHKGGQLKFDTSQITPYLFAAQEMNSTEGNELREKLANKPCLNANVLDHLLANQHLIPEEWKGKVVFFWGTIYHNSNGHLCVRYLIYRRCSYMWVWENYYIGDSWYRPGGGYELS